MFCVLLVNTKGSSPGGGLGEFTSKNPKICCGQVTRRKSVNMTEGTLANSYFAGAEAFLLMYV